MKPSPVWLLWMQFVPKNTPPQLFQQTNRYYQVFRFMTTIQLWAFKAFNKLGSTFLKAWTLRKGIAIRTICSYVSVIILFPVCYPRKEKPKEKEYSCETDSNTLKIRVLESENKAIRWCVHKIKDDSTQNMKKTHRKHSIYFLKISKFT